MVEVSHRRLALFCSAAVVLWAGHAAAQTAPPSAAQGANLTAESAGSGAQPTGTATTSGTPSVLSEVVVTAERRTTNLQNTAIAAQVLTGADLLKQGVTTVDQLQFATPSVTLQSFGQGNDFNIRGIGKGESNSTVGVGVITYRDGVATFPGYFQEEPYYDIASLEVLRGPQGTFIGQNATGGAVFITEANPNFNGFHGNLQAQYGNYNNAGLRGAINIPISDTLAARIAFNDEYRESYYDVTGAAGASTGLLKESSARVSLLWRPTSHIDVLFKTDLNYINTGGYPSSPATAKTDPLQISSDTHNFAEDKFGRTVLDASYTFDDGVKLRSVSGYQEGRTAVKYDLDGTDVLPFTLDDHVNEDLYSQEFNLISPEKGFFTWVTGLYYAHNRYNYPAQGQPGYEVAEPGFLDLSFSGKQVNETFAQFGQVSFNLPHGVQIQGGLRHTESSNSNNLNYTYAFPAFSLPIPQDQTERDSKVTGKVALNWTLDRFNFVYAFVATGHKSGGVNVPVAPGPAPLIKPEDVTDYEVGWKNEALSRHLRSQVGFYYYDYKDFQVTIGNPLLPTSGEVENVPSTTTLYGFELQEQAVFGHLSFDLGGSYQHSSLGTFFAADPRVPGVAATCDPNSGPANSNCVNLTGNKQVYAPSFTFDAGAQYAFVFERGTLTPRLDFGHIGTQYGTVFENAALGDKLGVRNLLNAQVAFDSGSWSIVGFGTNLNNQHYVSGLATGIRFAGAPRQYGVRLQKSF